MSRPSVRPLLLAFGLTVALTALLTLAPRANAALGDLTFSDCFKVEAANGCATNPNLLGADDVAVSPDGTSVYAVSRDSDSIVQFAAAPDGRLTFVACLSNGGGQGCGNLDVAPIENPSSVSISPDGNSVYVTGLTYSTVAHFARAGNGALTYVKCYGDTTMGGCTDVPGNSLTQPEEAAVSPNGNSLYVPARNADAINHFVRGPGGELTFAGCISSDGLGPCTDIAGNGFELDGAQGLAVSPDNGSVYVGSANPAGTISHFTTNAQGQLFFAGCVTSNNTLPCTQLSSSVLNYVASLAVSPDGSTLYGVGRDSDSLFSFTRGAGGSITFADCLSSNGQAGICDDVPGQPLDAAIDLVVSPDNKSVYALTFFGAALVHATPGAGGQLAFRDCQSDDGESGACTDLPGDTLFAAQGIAVSPDGDSIFTADLGDQVTHFVRQRTDGGGTPQKPKAKARKAVAGKPLALTASCVEACDLRASGTAKPKGGKKGKFKPVTKTAAAGESVKFKLKPKGKLKKQLKKAGKGKAKVAVKATYASGETATKKLKVKLK